MGWGFLKNAEFWNLIIEVLKKIGALKQLESTPHPESDNPGAGGADQAPPAI